MMPTIRVDDDVWRHLQSKAKPFEDTPNDVLRRELGLGQRGALPAQKKEIGRHETFKPDRDYARLRVRSYRLGSKKVDCRSFKEVLMTLCNELRLANASKFDSVALALQGKKRPYFSRTESQLRMPEQLVGTGLFVETNLNANLIVGICRVLLEKLGHHADELTLDVE